MLVNHATLPRKIEVSSVKHRRSSCRCALGTRYAPTFRPTLEGSTRNSCAPARDRAGARCCGTTRTDTRSLKDLISTRWASSCFALGLTRPESGCAPTYTLCPADRLTRYLGVIAFHKGASPNTKRSLSRDKLRGIYIERARKLLGTRQ